MNFALTDEQVLLREAARGSLARYKTIEAARAALEDPSALPDLWPVAIEAGWPGLLIGEQHGGAELDAFDAMLVAEECGRVLASVPLLGLIPATAILDAAGDESLDAVASGELRAAYVPTRPPDDREPRWTVEARSGMHRPDAPKVTLDGDAATVDGSVAFVPDAPEPACWSRSAPPRAGSRSPSRCRPRPMVWPWSRCAATTPLARSPM